MYYKTHITQYRAWTYYVFFQNPNKIHNMVAKDAAAGFHENWFPVCSVGLLSNYNQFRSSVHFQKWLFCESADKIISNIQILHISNQVQRERRVLIDMYLVPIVWKFASRGCIVICHLATNLGIAV